MKSKKITETGDTENVFEDKYQEWWDENGAFKALHTFNLVRVKFLQDSLDLNNTEKLNKLKILDIGCGGGIFCEPLTRLGANVSGIDANKKAIKIAKKHAESSNLKIEYLNTDITKFNSKNKFDVVTCMEVLEHVENIDLVLEHIKKNLKSGGLLIGSTINKNLISLISAIFLAENILKIVPKKTHEWKKFIKPNYLKKQLLIKNFFDLTFDGLFYNPFLNSWKKIENKSVNYIFSAKLK